MGYTAGGTKFIKNECWGLQALPSGGFIMSYGTGVENCNGMVGTMFTDCQVPPFSVFCKDGPTL